MCRTRSEYDAFKDIEIHKKGWKNEFVCPACHARLKQRWSTIVFSLVAVGFTGYLTFFTDFEYSYLVLGFVIACMFFLLYFGLIFKVEGNA